MVSNIRFPRASTGKSGGGSTFLIWVVIILVIATIFFVVNDKFQDKVMSMFD